mgnify:CR=1 FL=1
MIVPPEHMSTPRPAKSRVEPQRQCIGCGRRGPQSELLRLSLDRSVVPSRVRVAREREHQGRGAYLCRRQSCLDRALQRRAFQRAFRATVTPDVDDIMMALAAECPKAIEANNTAGG